MSWCLGLGCFYLGPFLWRGLTEGSVAEGVSTMTLSPMPLSPAVNVMIVIFNLF